MNLVNGQLELWVPTGNDANSSKTIIAVSNCGRIRRKNGTIEFTKLPHQILYKGKLTLTYRFICEHFIPKTEEDVRLNRTFVDHITHKPKGMNINDIRNMCWCTNKENLNFEEARRNMIKSEFGQLYFEKYGYSATQNIKQYYREYHYYHKYGKLRPSTQGYEGSEEELYINK